MATLSPKGINKEGPALTHSLARRAFNALAGMTLMLSILTSPTFAETAELIFNVFIPRPAPLYKSGLEPWARDVEAASEGTLKITIPTSSLAPPARQYDIVQDGVADMSVAPLAFRDKQLSLYTIGAIPLIAETAKGASIAFWDTHEKFLADVNQWQDFVPLTLFTLGAPSILSNSHPILSKGDLDGFKVLAVGKEKIATWRNLGASPVGGSGQKPFEVVSSGVADGTTNPLGTAVVQGLLEATRHVTLVPGGMGGRSAFAIFIDRDRFEALPALAQRALIDTSGARLAGKIGAIMDEHDAFGLKRFTEKGIKVHQAPQAFVDDVREASAFVTEAWTETAEGLGVDPAAALAHFRSVAASQ